MPVVIHKLTPWGKAVTCAMIERDLNPSSLSEILKSRGINKSRTAIIGMLRGYRGSRSEAAKDAINDILGISVDASGRPA